jgi:predicted transcriptional regulator
MRVMKRLSIMVDHDTFDRLRALARERNVSLAEIIRQALTDKAREFRSTPRSLGIAESAPARTSEFSGRAPPQP